MEEVSTVGVDSTAAAVAFTAVAAATVVADADDS
jgi:hypothetical protein